MFHLAAWSQSVNPAGVLTNINGVPDQAVFVSGLDIRVPTGLRFLLGAAAGYAGTGPLFAQVQSPTLRDLVNQDIEPISSGYNFSTVSCWQLNAENPRDLADLEAMDFAIRATGGAAALGFGLAWIGDGPIKPTTGKIFSLRATAGITLVASTWVNGPLTFNSTLPAGRYQVVGMRAQGANLVAARLVFIGGTYRPGVPGQTTNTTDLFPEMRNGEFGIFGQFDSNQPPTLDALGQTDTAQDIVLDLIQVGKIGG